jgi:hypothetical protein
MAPKMPAAAAASTFENRQCIDVDLEPLIGNYVSVEQATTAELDSEWDCLQFNGGAVDIEPNTLYRFALDASGAEAA